MSTELRDLREMVGRREWQIRQLRDTIERQRVTIKKLTMAVNALKGRPEEENGEPQT